MLGHSTPKMFPGPFHPVENGNISWNTSKTVAEILPQVQGLGAWKTSGALSIRWARDWSEFWLRIPAWWVLVRHQMSVKVRLHSSHCSLFHSSIWVANPKSQGGGRVDKLPSTKVKRNRSCLRHVLFGGGGLHAKTNSFRNKYCT